MSILIEALCLVVPNRVLDVSYPGGAPAFIDDLSTRDDLRYVITDGILCAASMFDPGVAVELANHLEEHGIVGAEDRQALEFVLTDMEVGTTIPCDWIETVRHPHGFMIAWAVPGERGPMAVPGDWDPSRSWGLGREDVRNTPERNVILAREEGFDTFLDLETGRIDQALGTVSPVVTVGSSAPEEPDTWQLVDGLTPSLQTVQAVLQRVGIPYHVDKELGAIRIAFLCDVRVDDEAGGTVSREIPQRVLVTEGPGVHGVTCTTVLPLRVPSHLRADAAKIARAIMVMGGTLSLDFEPLTGTVAIIISTLADELMDPAVAERVVANASPVAGSCYEELVSWLQGNESVPLTAMNITSHEPARHTATEA